MQCPFCIYSYFITARDSTKIEYIEAYLKANGMYRDYDHPDQDPAYTEVISCYHSDDSNISNYFCFLKKINFSLSIFCFYGNLDNRT